MATTDRELETGCGPADGATLMDASKLTNLV
jgi:hypothetical protein